MFSNSNKATISNHHLGDPYNPTIMNKSVNLKRLLLITGVIMALFLLVKESGTAQTVVKQNSEQAVPQIKEYKCTPCGCSEDDTIVHEPGKCKKCGMALINIHDPNEGLNYTNLTAQEVCKLIETNPELILLDVRSTAEFNSKTSPLGRFKKAINIPIMEINNRIAELEIYKDKEILVYCSISARSPRVSKILADSGYKKIRNLMGGLNNWHQQSSSELPCQASAIQKF